MSFWTEEVWLAILAAHPDGAEFPSAWAELPAIGRLTITRPELLGPFDCHNRRHPDRPIRPHSFVSVAYPKAFARAEDIRLFAPYVSDPRHALEINWYELRSGEEVRVTTADLGGTVLRGLIPVKSYAEIARDYSAHPEAKFLSPAGTECLRKTRGTLARRSIRTNHAEYVGKEGNMLHRRAEGSGVRLEVQEIYDDPIEWELHVLSELRHLPLGRLADAAGISDRGLRAILAGQASPRKSTRLALERALDELGHFPLARERR